MKLYMHGHKRLLIPLLVACSALGERDAASSQVPEPLQRIRVHENRLVGDTGAPVVLRGVSFSDPDWLDDAGQWNRAYFQAAADWNANLVRFPVHPPWWRERGEEAYLRLLDQGVAWATELGMYVIIDWHSIGNLVTEQFFRPEIYETTRAETLHFWQTIARRYAGNPTVAFYELFTEPTDFNETLGRLTWTEHREVMEEIISAIREHDPDAIPLVSGLEFGYDLSGVLKDPVRRPGVAYVSHPYPQKREPPWEEKWERDFGFVADSYPVVATELGFMSEDGPGAHVPVIGDETYGEAVIDYFESKNISWTAWVFDTVWSPQLIENWDFEPTRQGRFFRDKLMTLNPEP